MEVDNLFKISKTGKSTKPEIRLVIGERQGCQRESTDLWFLLVGGGEEGQRCSKFSLL